MRNKKEIVSRLLVALVLLIGASSFFVGCKQPSSSSSSSSSGSGSGSGSGSSSDEVIIEIWGGEKATFSHFDKSKHSAVCSYSEKDPLGVSHNIIETATFSGNFATVTFSDRKVDGVLGPEPPATFTLVNGVATFSGPGGASEQVDFNPVINKLK